MQDERYCYWCNKLAVNKITTQMGIDLACEEHTRMWFTDKNEWHLDVDKVEVINAN